MMREAVKLKNGKIISKPLKNDGDKLDYIISTINDMKTDISGLKTDVSCLKTDVSCLKTDVSCLKTDVNDIKTTLQDVKRRGDATFEEVGKMRVEISEIRDEMGVINGRLDRLENPKHARLAVA